jgi:hypothetical protein
MSLSSKYNFSDFTECNYKKILRLAKEKYKNFIFFNETHKYEEFVIWRHDVDVSIHRALKLAEIEFKQNVKSTYFILITSENYSIFEKDIRNKLLKISSLGHEIGLHFDANYYEIQSKNDLIKYLNYEKNILEGLINKKINTFSFHVPIANEVEFNDYRISGMLNVYSNFYNKIDYTSDSGGIWRHRRLEDVILERKNKKLQVLTHPVWWQKTAISPRDRVQRSFNGRLKNISYLYDKHLVDNNRENIGHNKAHLL